MVFRVNIEFRVWRRACISYQLSSFFRTCHRTFHQVFYELSVCISFHHILLLLSASDLTLVFISCHACGGLLLSVDFVFFVFIQVCVGIHADTQFSIVVHRLCHQWPEQISSRRFGAKGWPPPCLRCLFRSSTHEARGACLLTFSCSCAFELLICNMGAFSFFNLKQPRTFVCRNTR